MKRIVGEAVGLGLFAAATLVGCSSSAPKQEAPTSIKDRVQMAAEIDIDNIIVRDLDDYLAVQEAIEKAKGGDLTMALTTANEVDNEGGFTRTDARDMVEPYIGELAVQQIRAGHSIDTAIGTINPIDEIGSYTHEDALKAIERADHTK